MTLARYAWSALVALLAVLAAAPSAPAQDYPTRPVTIIVPFAPGGSADIGARMFAQKLTERLGKPVVVENRAGVGTVIGANAVAKAAPDGYTLLMGGSSALAYNVTLHKSLPYDPVRDFVPLAHVAAIPFVLVVQRRCQCSRWRTWSSWRRTSPATWRSGPPASARPRICAASCSEA
jgi:tripartite-type tricarboxylate transporter receptor subunit TctC